MEEERNKRELIKAVNESVNSSRKTIAELINRSIEAINKSIEVTNRLIVEEARLTR